MTENLYQIQAAASVVDERTRVLKQGDTFAVFDRFGNVKPGGLGEEGLFHEGTRYLSSLTLKLAEGPPFLLGSTIGDDNDQLMVALTNPDLIGDGLPPVPMGTLHLGLKQLLWEGVCYQSVRVKNHGRHTVQCSLSWDFDADFADIFEVRGMHRRIRGEYLPAEVSNDHVVLAYRGRDDVIRRTVLRFAPHPVKLGPTSAQFRLKLAPEEELAFYLTVSCECGKQKPNLLSFPEARALVQTDLERFRAWSCHLHTPDGQVNAWVNRAVADLHVLTTQLPFGTYPYAGVPWFSTPFGRDGIITALECLWIRPALAKGVLSYLAATQASELIPEQDAEPGKILHETRKGEMAALKEIPFGRYYGSVDSTPLFIVLAGAYYRRTADREFAIELWPHVEAALEWITHYGDRDGDGFVEYQSRARNGLVQQGWKDSDDSVFHDDGTLATAPIALCEVQGYVYQAWRAAALLARVLGHDESAARLEQKADTLRQQFDAAFWSPDLATYVLALAGEAGAYEKRRCSVRSSNAGHCLFSGIAEPKRAPLVARTLLNPDSFSGWGIRTVPVSEARYNPMAYHNGSVWPHDNALIAQGLARYGMTEGAVQILEAMFKASCHFDMYRMPELFCGFTIEAGSGPTLYPVACSPQAWAAASVFQLFQACLGLEIDAEQRQISFARPRLPAFVSVLRIHHLEVAGARIDLSLVRHEHNVSVNVLRREGEVQIRILE